MLPSAIAGPPALAVASERRPAPAQATARADSAPRGKKLVFAIDGLSYGIFQVARSKGLFKSFARSGQHIAPYPSMTDPSWTEVMGGKKLFPLQGNIKTIEASFFDVDSMTLLDDPRNVFNRAALDHNYFRAFDYFYNPVLEGLMYFPNDSTYRMELDQLESEIASGFSGDPFIAYVSMVDAIAHTQKDKLYPVLEKLSATIEKIVDTQRRKNPGLEAWLISDHGNVGGFTEGEPETYLRTVDLKDAARAAGLRVVDSRGDSRGEGRDAGKLRDPDQISLAILALGNMGNYYFKDLGRRRAFALQAVLNPAVDLVTYSERDGKNRFVTLIGPADPRSPADGASEARLYWSSRGYLYQAIRGNPLKLDSRLVSTGATPKWIGDPEMFEALASGPYPDAAFRLFQNANKQVENEPDLIVNLKQGFCFEGPFSRFVQMVRTHGALDAGSSLGLIASTGPEVPRYVRSQDVLAAIGITPAIAFHKVSDLFHEDPQAVLKKVLSARERGIPTRVIDLSGEMIFRRINKAIGLSTDFFPAAGVRELVDRIKGIVSLLNREAQGGAPEGRPSLDEVVEILKKVDIKQALDHVDGFFALKEVALSTQDPELLASRLAAGITSIPGLTPLAELKPIFGDAGQGGPGDGTGDGIGDLQSTLLNIVRQSAMKLYAFPYLLDEWLNLPEYDAVRDPRDLDFAASWFAGKKSQVQRDPVVLMKEKELPRTLFSEIFSERVLKASLAPASFPLLYNPVPRDVTVVYIPGIYNELFDTEIFSRGLRALRDNLGLRVIYLDVDGRCSTEKNARTIYEGLLQDMRQRVERGHPAPRYLILGYSKGGLDATEALLIDPEFTRKRILGLVSIASPHQGTSILETVDLPALLVDQTVARPLPAECREGLYANGSRSVRRDARESFWARNLARLVGLTRYYSISFVSEVEESHPWMKITKNIARFQSPNDGVVPLESSRFPESLQAVDLGSVQADHLAGILASKFPQGPFLEAILLSLFEMSAFDPANALAWHEAIARSSRYLIKDYYKRKLAAKVLKAAQAAAKTAPGSVAVVDAMGPFPESGASRPQEADGWTDGWTDNWYDTIAREEKILESPIPCASPSAYRNFSKRLRALTSRSPFALKPFSLECTRIGVILLRITVRKQPFYLPWEPDVVRTLAVKNLDELVSAFLSIGLSSEKNLLEAGETMPVTLPRSDRPALILPPSSLSWSPEAVINLRSFNKTLENARVQPILPGDYKEGFSLNCDQMSVKEFRKEYGFQYESTSPMNVDDNPETAYSMVLESEGGQGGGGGKDFVACRMRSRNSSIRVTTPAIRFKPAEFPNFGLQVKVTRGPEGADPAKGGSGKDDSAFQLWFTLRDVRGVSDRSRFTSEGGVRVFGYYWAEDLANGASLPSGSLIENYYSNKNYLVTTLPEAWQIVIAGASARGKWVDFRRNLLKDLQAAFPHEDMNNFEVVGITIQTDSNDTRTDSEAFLRKVTFGP